MISWTGKYWREFLLAAQFLTRLPVPGGVEFSPARFAATPRWYPAVGLVIGVITAGVWWVLSFVFPPLIAALGATAAGVMITGGLHEDGFADVCDGLGGGANRARALEIMRDSRLGTYGVLGLILLIAVKVAAISELGAEVVPFAIVAAHALSRASCVLTIATGSYARGEGAGKLVGVDAAPDTLIILAGSILFAVVVSLSGAGLFPVLGGLAGIIIAHIAMRRRFEARLGGYTGDCLGAIQQTGEAGFLLGVLACL